MKGNWIQDKLCLAIANLFGLGYVPLIPGTAASVAAVIAFIFIKSPSYFCIFTFISIILSFLCCGRAEKVLDEKDSKKIVIDDFSGMLIALLWIPKRLEFILAGFLLFRIMDIIKMPPADRIEKYNGAKGIVGDDIVAGIYANVILHLIRGALNIFS